MSMKRKNSDETIVQQIASVLLVICEKIWDCLMGIWRSDGMDFLRFASLIIGGTTLVIVLILWGLSLVIHFPTYEEKLEFYTQSYAECMEQESISVQSCEEIARYLSSLGD